jgi:L,D-peptidoglycan transpeptidase YkuD (ErfK/YbiS/YcfS/YnhG family)
MRVLMVILIVGALEGCSPKGADCIGPPRWTIPTEAEQVIEVRRAGSEVFKVQVTAHERHSDEWPEILTSQPGVIGPKGFAEPGAKREGDGHTPGGVYRIGMAFGYEATMDTGLEYRQTTADDRWVDDADSSQYNRWVTGKPLAKSFEDLRQDAYKYAAVIEYNTDPVVPGHGSAIFLHVWSGPGKPTAGCVALAEADVRALLKWLDKRRHPVIVLNAH